MSSQLSSITSRLDKLEQPQTYSPSAPVALWAPPRTSRPKPGQQGYSARDEPTDDLQEDDLNALPSSMDAAGDYFHDVPPTDFQSSTFPSWPDSYLTELYRTRLGLAADQDLMGSQNEFALSLPGIFILFCNSAHLSANHPLSQFDEPAFWDFVTKYTTSSDSHLLSLQPSAQQPQSTDTAPAAQTSGSIRLFPPRAPSQPPAPLDRPAAASAMPQGMSAGFPFRAVPPGAAGPTGSAPVPPPPPPPPTAQWSVMGKGNKPRSFAAAAAASRRTAPVVVSPIRATLRPGDLTDSQLASMTRDQLLTAYESRFRLRVTSRNVSKLSLQMAYKRNLELEAVTATAPPPKPANQRPKPRLVNTTEFTVTRDPSTVAIRGPQGDAAAIVRSLQTSI